MDSSQNKAYRSELELQLPLGRRETVRRINRAMDYMDAHLTEKIYLERLASEASFSPHHFVRVFTQVSGQTPLEFLRRLRVERAAVLLTAHYTRSILDIALAVGFHSATAFARAFQAHFGMSATQWRRGGFWRPCGLCGCWRPTPCDECPEPGDYVETINSGLVNLPTDRTPLPQMLSDIRIETLPPMRMAYMRMVGPLQTKVVPLVQRLARWMAVRGLDKPDAMLVGMVVDPPSITAQRLQRCDFGVLVDDAFEPDRYVNVRYIPGGSYVTGRYVGLWREDVLAWRYFWNVWLPQNGRTASGAPSFQLFQVRDNPRAVDFRTDMTLNFKLCLPLTSS
jgi:AraC family transcriptional regulator